jgi:Ubiquitin-conjugating enzyme
MLLLWAYRYVYSIRPCESSKGTLADNDMMFKFLFLEPNASDPLNKDAAQELRDNRESFKRNVKASMAGGSIRGEKFDRVLRSGS